MVKCPGILSIEELECSCLFTLGNELTIPTMHFRSGIPSDTQLETYKLLLNVTAWGVQNDAPWKNCPLIIALKVTSSGEYFKACNIIVWLENCSYDQLTVIESSKYKSASRNSVVEWFSGLQTSMQWRLGHIRFHNIQPNDLQNFSFVSWNLRPQLLLLHMYTSC